MSDEARRYVKRSETALNSAESLENQVAAQTAALVGNAYATLAVAACLLEGVVYVKDSDRV